MTIASICFTDLASDLMDKSVEWRTRRAGSGTVLALFVLWAAGTLVGWVAAVVAKLRNRETPLRKELLVSLIWPALIALGGVLSPIVLLPFGVVLGMTFLGEILGRRWGHPLVGSFTGMGVTVLALVWAVWYFGGSGEREPNGTGGGPGKDSGTP